MLICVGACNETRGSNEDPWVLSTAAFPRDRRVTRGMTDTKATKESKMSGSETMLLPKEGNLDEELGVGTSPFMIKASSMVYNCSLGPPFLAPSFLRKPVDRENGADPLPGL